MHKNENKCVDASFYILPWNRRVNKMQKNRNKKKKLLQSERKPVGHASISNLVINNKHLLSL